MFTHPGIREVDRLLVAELAIAFFIGSAILLFAASVLELRSQRAWVKSVQGGDASSGGQRRVAVYFEVGNLQVAFQMLPVLIIGPILPFVLYAYLGEGYETSTNDLLAIAGLYIVLGLGAKAIVTRYIRRGSFVASDDGIEVVKVKRGRCSTVKSIKWKDVTKVDLYEIIPDGMGIDAAGKRIIVPYNMENLEPLFEIMRRKVPKDVIRKGA
jgi:hypothetical protein